MISLIVWAPLGVSLILGTVFVFFGDAPPAVKIVGAVFVLVAAYLQLFSRHALAGLLLQVALSLALALWWRMRGAT